MPPSHSDIVRTLASAVLERDASVAWPPSEDEFDERMRTDLVGEAIDIRNPPEFPVGSRYEGHEGMRRWATDVWEVYRELRNEFDEVVEIAPDTVLTVQRTEGVFRHTGLTTRFRWAVIWRVRDSKLVASHGYVSREKALEAIAAQAPAAAAVLALTAAYNAHDAGAICALCTEDVEVWTYIEGRAEQEPYRGHDGIRAWQASEREAWERLEITEPHVRELGDGRVLGLATVVGRGRGSGVELRIESGWIFEVRDGKVAALRAYDNRDDALDAAGAAAA